MTKEQELLQLRLGEDWEGIVKKVEARDRLARCKRIITCWATCMINGGIAVAVVAAAFLLAGILWDALLLGGIILGAGGLSSIFIGLALFQKILPELNEVDEVKSLLRMRDAGIIKFKDEDIAHINIAKNHNGKWVVNKNKAQRIE